MSHTISTFLTRTKPGTPEIRPGHGALRRTIRNFALESSPTMARSKTTRLHRNSDLRACQNRTPRQPAPCTCPTRRLPVYQICPAPRQWTTPATRHLQPLPYRLRNQVGIRRNQSDAAGVRLMGTTTSPAPAGLQRSLVFYITPLTILHHCHGLRRHRFIGHRTMCIFITRY